MTGQAGDAHFMARIDWMYILPLMATLALTAGAIGILFFAM